VRARTLPHGESQSFSLLPLPLSLSLSLSLSYPCWRSFVDRRGVPLDNSPRYHRGPRAPLRPGRPIRERAPRGMLGRGVGSVEAGARAPQVPSVYARSYIRLDPVSHPLPAGSRRDQPFSPTLPLPPSGRAEPRDTRYQTWRARVRRGRGRGARTGGQGGGREAGLVRHAGSCAESGI